MYNDIFNETRGQLIEAKGSAGRPSVRMAIGQLLDYANLEAERPALALLVPEPPSPDLTALLDSLDVVAIWPVGRRFADTADGRFV